MGRATVAVENASLRGGVPAVAMSLADGTLIGLPSLGGYHVSSKPVPIIKRLRGLWSLARASTKLGASRQRR
jgi:hypothetical protein